MVIEYYPQLKNLLLDTEKQIPPILRKAYIVQAFACILALLRQTLARHYLLSGTLSRRGWLGIGLPFHDRARDHILLFAYRIQ